MAEMGVGQNAYGKIGEPRRTKPRRSFPPRRSNSSRSPQPLGSTADRGIRRTDQLAGRARCARPLQAWREPAGADDMIYVSLSPMELLLVRQDQCLARWAVRGRCPRGSHAGCRCEHDDRAQRCKLFSTACFGQNGGGGSAPTTRALRLFSRHQFGAGENC